MVALLQLYALVLTKTLSVSLSVRSRLEMISGYQKSFGVGSVAVLVAALQAQTLASSKIRNVAASKARLEQRILERAAAATAGKSVVARSLRTNAHHPQILASLFAASSVVAGKTQMHNRIHVKFSRIQTSESRAECFMTASGRESHCNVI